MKKIFVVVPENAVIEAISPGYRLFKTANQFIEAMGNQTQFEVNYIGKNKYVKTNDGEYTVTTNFMFSEITHADLVIIPAIYGDIDHAIEANQEAIEWVKNVYENGSEIASLCIGAFLLASSGLVNQKKCSTHWAYYHQFNQMFPEVKITEGSIITDDEKIYSSGGANSLWNLLLYILEKYSGREIAIIAAKYFAIDIDRSNQNIFTIFSGQKKHNDTPILEVQNLLENNFSQKHSIDNLAEKANLSRRSFERRFKNATYNTPIEYLQRVRIEAAKRMFENSIKNVNEVMYEVGYNDSKAFRDVFKKISGLSPIDYRVKYAKVANK